MLGYEIPEEFTGIARYLKAGNETEEFTQTCPDPGEIIWTYGGRKPRPGGWKKQWALLYKSATNAKFS